MKAVWDSRHATFNPYAVDRRLISTELFWNLLGDVRQKTTLDLGCGTGDLAVLLSLAKARVTAIDSSEAAIAGAKRQAAFNRAPAIDWRCLNAFELGVIERKFDLITGRYILHHIEPFREFVPALHEALKPGGRAVFIENLSRNPLLMLSRKHLIGRFGLPRRSDGVERPLAVSELRMLEAKFKRVTVIYPELVLFRLIARYFFPQHEYWAALFNRLDRLAYKHFPGLRKYGYVQVIVLEK